MLFDAKSLEDVHFWDIVDIVLHLKGQISQKPVWGRE